MKRALQRSLRIDRPAYAMQRTRMGWTSQFLQCRDIAYASLVLQKKAKYLGGGRNAGPAKADLWHNPPMANLHDRLAFPTFEDCPGEYDVTPRYWKDSNGDLFFKRVRHWCFLGEIVDILTLPRLFLIVRDILGNKALAAFHTNDAGRGLLRTGNVKEGHTFALLYAQQHLFLSGHMGFRIEHPGLAKVIPYPMDHLLKANDKLQSVPSGCWAPGCGKDADATTCNGCGIAKYCGQEHQQLGWKQGHKQECKAFAELKWFLQRDWSTFHNNFFF